MFEKFAQFFSVSGAAAHILHLLQTEGATALDAVRQGLTAIRAFTGRDCSAVFAALNKVNVDVEEVVAAVKSEFGL